MKKSLFFILLTLCMVLTLLPFGASAASGTCGDNLTWTLDSDGLLTISGTGNMMNYTAYYDHYKGSVYCNSPFFSRSTAIQSVVIEEGVTSIGVFAFYGCTGLTSVTIPESVTSIGAAAFENCTSLTSVFINDIAAWCSISFSSTVSNPLYYAHNLYLNGSLVTDLTIPSSVTSIGHCSFAGCTSLTNITIPSSVTSIGSSAFSGCTSLTNITIPPSVTSIGSSAFQYCEGLTSVTLPEGVTSIGYSAFYECSSLTSVTIPSSVTSIDAAAFGYCGSLTSVTIPDSVTSIGNYAFEECKSLTSVTIPSSVTNVGGGVFENCTRLNSVTIMAGCCALEANSFENCAIREVIISGSGEMNPSNYASEKSPFYNKSSIKTVVVEDGVTGISGRLFENCTGLTNVTIPACLSFGNDTGSPFYGSGGSKTLELTGAGPMNCILKNWKVQRVTIGSDVTSISAYAFSDCGKLTNVTIPSSVTSIADCAFLNCTSLRSITIPSSVTRFGINVFNGCSALSTINYDRTTEQAVKAHLYTGMPQNTIVKTSDNRPIDSSGQCGTSTYYVLLSDGKLLIYGYETTNNSIANDSKFYNNTTVRDVEIEDGVVRIGNFTFYGCSNLESISLPGTLETIRSKAFAGCSSLKDVTFDGKKKQWNQIEMLDGNEPLLQATVHCLGDVAPEIVSHPQSNTAAEDDRTEFTVSATGTDLEYQWQYKSPGSSTWKNSSMTGARTEKLSVTAIASRNGQQYRCVVSNDASSVTSEPATLTVCPEVHPRIAAQTETLTANEGDVVSFTVSARGGNLTYQWQFKAPGKDTWNNSSMSGAKTSKLTVEATAARSGQQYRCVVKNSIGSATSEAATLNVIGRPRITSQPKNFVAKNGDMVTFSVSVKGDNLTYQWQFKAPGTSTWYNSTATGAKTATLTVEATAARSGQEYCCIAKNTAGSVTSEAATLLVVTNPAISAQPENAFAAEGDTATFTVKASGGNLSYQWQYQSPGTSAWYDSGMSGAKTATLSVPVTAARSGQQYRCIVKNAAGSVTSKTVMLTVVTSPTISAQPESVLATPGSTVTFTVKATGGGLSYQWQFQAPGTGTWNNSTMTGAKTATLSVEATTERDGQKYRCIVKNAIGSTTSEAATLTVGWGPQISMQPKNCSAPAGETVKFTVTASGPNLTYQWQFKAPGATAWYNSSMSGAKTPALQVPVTVGRDGQQYRCIVKNTLGRVTSNAATLTVISMPKIMTQPQSVAAADGETVTFTVQAIGGDLTYQWQFKAPGTSTWYNSTAAGAKTASLTVEATAARNGQQYCCIVKNAVGSIRSDPAKLTVK